MCEVLSTIQGVEASPDRFDKSCFVREEACDGIANDLLGFLAGATRYGSELCLLFTGEVHFHAS